MHILPELPGCGQPATTRILGIASPDGDADSGIYTCTEHASDARAALLDAGRTVETVLYNRDEKRCGDGWDFATARTLTAPNLAGDR